MREGQMSGGAKSFAAGTITAEGARVSGAQASGVAFKSAEGGATDVSAASAGAASVVADGTTVKGVQASGVSARINADKSADRLGRALAGRGRREPAGAHRHAQHRGRAPLRLAGRHGRGNVGRRERGHGRFARRRSRRERAARAPALHAGAGGALPRERGLEPRRRRARRDAARLGARRGRRFERSDSAQRLRRRCLQRSRARRRRHQHFAARHLFRRGDLRGRGRGRRRGARFRSGRAAHGRGHRHGEPQLPRHQLQGGQRLPQRAVQRRDRQGRRGPHAARGRAGADRGPRPLPHRPRQPPHGRDRADRLGAVLLRGRLRTSPSTSTRPTRASFSASRSRPASCPTSKRRRESSASSWRAISSSTARVAGDLDSPLVNGRVELASLTLRERNLGAAQRRHRVERDRDAHRQRSPHRTRRRRRAVRRRHPARGRATTSRSRRRSKARTRATSSPRSAAASAASTSRTSRASAPPRGASSCAASPARWKATPTCASAAGRIGSQPYDEIAARATFSGSKVNIETIEARLPAGRINATGTVDIDAKSFDIRAEGKDVRLDLVTELFGAQPGLPALGGLADFNATAAAANLLDPTTFRVELNAQGRDVTVNGQPAGVLTLTGRTTRRPEVQRRADDGPARQAAGLARARSTSAAKTSPPPSRRL